MPDIHVRQQIRSALLSTLSAGQSPVSQWLGQRRLPLQKSQSSVGLIYNVSEASSVASIGPEVRLSRVLSIIIAGRFKGDDNVLDDLADDFAAFVELTLCSDRTLGGLAQDLHLRSTSIDSDQEGEAGYLSISLEFLITYHTRDNSPTTTI